MLEYILLSLTLGWYELTKKITFDTILKAALHIMAVSSIIIIVLSLYFMVQGYE